MTSSNGPFLPRRRPRSPALAPATPMLDLAQVTRMTCPACGQAVRPATSCVRCGLGIPRGMEPDWCRNRTVLPTMAVAERDEKW